MISDFHQLYEKISQLAELTQSLRGENADLRLKVAALAAENANLAKRMLQAHERVTALMEKISVVEQDEETE